MSDLSQLTPPILLDRLQWRYAAKKMDATKAVPQDKVDRIIEAARLAPTSSGLQPFEIVVVTSPSVREQIKPIAWNQAQITDGSHLLVFAAWDNYTAERINHMFDLTNAQRGGTNEGWEKYRQMLLNSYPQREAEVNFEHAARKCLASVELADIDPIRGDVSGLLVVDQAKNNIEFVPFEFGMTQQRAHHPLSATASE